MKHIDLFSGIGGFSYAVDQIFHEQKNQHTFIEIDPYCQQVLKKHWPDAEIIGDIRSFANTRSKKQRGVSGGTRKKISPSRIGDKPFLLTGGFPCQPFSQAGRRKGTSDDRHLWPEMLRVIRNTKPEWIIAENVRGLITIDEGMVFEQVCLDLESEGYAVQPFIIPAVALNAPHRRDRIWFVANTKHKRTRDAFVRGNEKGSSVGIAGSNKNASDSGNAGLERGRKTGARHGRFADRTGGKERSDWDKNWLKVATRLCRVDDGIPKGVDRAKRLKALGNAIVPQVAMKILEAIKLSR